jgi:hypothetical protein
MILVPSPLPEPVLLLTSAATQAILGDHRDLWRDRLMVVMAWSGIELFQSVGVDRFQASAESTPVVGT